MKKSIFIFYILFFNLVNAQAQQCVWAKQSHGNKDNLSNTVVTDASGNIYVAGSFDSDSVTFGAIKLVNPDSFTTKIFLVKYDSSGNVIWAKTFAGNIDAYLYTFSMTIDGSGNLYLCGNFESPTITFGATTLTNIGGDDIFLVKMSSSGSVIWAKSARCKPLMGGGQYSDVASGIAADASGHIVIAGYFDSSVTFGSTYLANVSSYPNIFVAKYDTSGNVIWAKCSSGPGGGYLTAKIAVDASGNTYVTGNCGSGPTSFGSVTITPISGSNEMFMLKFNSSGTALWAVKAGDTCIVVPYDVVTDAAGDISVTGGFGCTTTFGTVAVTNSSTSGGDNIFLAKYNSSGTVIWAKSMGGANNDDAHGLTTDASANIYLTGMISSPSVAFGATTLVNIGIFVAKYSASGNPIWAKGGASLNSAAGISIARDVVGNLCVTGGFNGIPFTIDGITLTPTTGTAGYLDVFTAKFKDISAGVPVTNEDINMLLFPNPAHAQLTIQSANQPINEITITNLLGQEIKGERREGIGQREVRIDVSGLPEGIYFVKINGSEVRRFVKQ